MFDGNKHITVFHIISVSGFRISIKTAAVFFHSSAVFTFLFSRNLPAPHILSTSRCDVTAG